MGLPAPTQQKGPIVEMTHEPLPKRVRKTPVSHGVHIAEELLVKYRILAERLKDHLDYPEVLLLDEDVRRTQEQVTEGIREVGRETYPERKNSRGATS